jgi:tetratricopeptide (TPR) repeat protein
MGEFWHEKWCGLWWRLPLAAFFLFFAARLFMRGVGGGGWGSVPALIFAAAALIVGATIMAPAIAEWLAGVTFAPLAGLLFPERKITRRPPTYGPAEARRMEAQYEKAIQEYEAILMEYPNDGQSFLALMDIAWRDMGDARRAMNYYHRARVAVKDEGYLQEMKLAYEDFAPYLQMDDMDQADGMDAHG